MLERHNWNRNETADARRDAVCIYHLAFGALSWHLRHGRAPSPAEIERVVDFATRGNAVDRSPPRVLFSGVYGRDEYGDQSWDVAPDGSIAVLTPAASSQAPSAERTVVFLENFFDELRRRVPVGK